MARETYEILTLADVIQTYAKLPTECGELMLKEIGDAVRMMAPLVGVADLTGPLRWINDDKGVGTVNFVAEPGGDPLGSVNVDLNGGSK